MSSETPAPITWRLTSMTTGYGFTVQDAPDVDRPNRDAVVPRFVHVDVAERGGASSVHVKVTGPARRKDGSEGITADVRWSDVSNDRPPQWILNLLAANGIEWGRS